MGNYKDTKKSTEAFYSKIDLVDCPAINDHIAFNKFGFRHLIWKGSLQRPRGEQMRRFSLIPYAPKILASQHLLIIYKDQKTVRFWTFIKEQDGVTIKLIVR